MTTLTATASRPQGDAKRTQSIASARDSAPGAADEGACLHSQCPSMRHVIAQIERVADVSTTVLLSGESGTGKEVMARVLHERSRRRRGPFVPVNCAALPEGLLESELFGHERGAFTGASQQRVGRFELAHRGTIFLDEIGAADARVQTRLLRVLQERTFERLGGSAAVHVDVRIVAASNLDLAQAVSDGAFREDLFYRLNVVPIQLPPLRERRDDIPALVEHLVRQVARRNGCPVPQIGPGVLERLCGYDWPGNVRQLENTVERMVVLGDAVELTPGDVPLEIAEAPAGMPTAEPDSFHEARDMFERRFLCRALRRHRGVISQVADAIGMSRKNLYTKLDALQIDYGRYRS